MATVAGKFALVTLGGSKVCYGHAWSLDIVADELDDTNWCWSLEDEGWRSFIFGLKGANGTIECYLDKEATPLLPGIEGDAILYMHKTSRVGYRGDIMVTGVHPGADIGDIQSVTLDVRITGALKPVVKGTTPEPPTTAAPPP